jgi:hypothetical protein
MYIKIRREYTFNSSRGNLLFYHTQQLKSELLPKFDQNVSSKHSWSCVFIVKQVSIFLC